MKGQYFIAILAEQERRNGRPTLVKRLLESRAENSVHFPDQEGVGMHRHLDKKDAIDRLIDLGNFCTKNDLDALSEAVDRRTGAICPKDAYAFHDASKRERGGGEKSLPETVI